MDPLAPPVPLQDHCSVIKDDTLYVYSPDAFQSIPLKDGGRWSQHKNGVSVSGAKCVKGGDSSDGDDGALWIVGGKSTEPNYPGLQKYSFASKTWRTIVPVTPVTQNRQGHAATYLEDSGALLVYGGSQNGATIPSIETFSISIQSPYGVESYTSRNTPVTSPVLLRWNSSTAVAMGGLDVSNKPNLEMDHFNMPRGWHQYGRPLAANPSADSKQNTLVTGSDGSIILTTFNLGVSPNQVSQVLLQRPDGRPARTGQTVGEPPRKRARRQVSATANNWPTYKDQLAPTGIKSDFSLAQGSDGMVAITGGGGGTPILLFNEQRNAWVNTSNFFGTPVMPDQTVFGPSSTNPSPSSSTTSDATGLPTVDDGHPKTSMILGATLGSILGFVALMIIILLFIRYKRRQKRLAQTRRQENEKQRLSFADRGDPFMMETGNTGFRPSETAHSSAIIGGQYNPRHQRNTSTRGSDSSTARLVPNIGPPMGPNETMEMETIEEKRTSSLPPNGNGSVPISNMLGLPKPKRTSGWSRYFSGNEAAALAVNSGNDSRKSDVSSRKSQRSLKSLRNSGRASSGYASSVHDCNSHGPTEIPPLNLGQQFQGAKVGKMVTGESNSRRNSISAIETTRRDTSPPRPRTVESQISTVPPSTADETIFSHDASDNSSWTPVTRSDWTSMRHRDTATSSIYSHRGYDVDTTPGKTNSHGPIPVASSIRPSNSLKQPGDASTRPLSGVAQTTDVPVYPPKQAERVILAPERISIIEEDIGPKSESGPPKAALTAIPIPSGTATATIVRKKPAIVNDKTQNTDMSWVKLATE